DNPPPWPDEERRQWPALQQGASGDNPRSAAPQVAFRRNVLARVPDFRQSLNAVKTPAEFVGEPFMTFIKLPSPSSETAAPDEAISFNAEPINAGSGKWYWAGLVSLDGEGPPTVVVANGRAARVGGVTLSFPGKTEFEELSTGVIG